jgi:hypothetical protein
MVVPPERDMQWLLLSELEADVEAAAANSNRAIRAHSTAYLDPVARANPELMNALCVRRDVANTHWLDAVSRRDALRDALHANPSPTP